MVNKAVILFLVASFAAQISSKATPAPRDLVDIALEVLSNALKAFTTVLEDTLNLAKSALESLSDNSDILRQNIVNAADKALAQAKEDLKQQLEILKNETSSEVGVDIIDCAEIAEDTLETNVHNTVNASSDCVADLISQIALDLEAVIADLETVNEGIKQYEDLVGLCQNATEVQTCVLEDLQKIIQVVQSIEDQINQDFEKVTDDIGKLVKAGETCIQPNLESLEKENLKCFDDFASCVEGKIKSKV